MFYFNLLSHICESSLFSLNSTFNIKRCKVSRWVEVKGIFERNILIDSHARNMFDISTGILFSRKGLLGQSMLQSHKRSFREEGY